MIARQFINKKIVDFRSEFNFRKGNTKDHFRKAKVELDKADALVDTDLQDINSPDFIKSIHGHSQISTQEKPHGEINALKAIVQVIKDAHKAIELFLEGFDKYLNPAEDKIANEDLNTLQRILKNFMRVFSYERFKPSIIESLSKLDDLLKPLEPSSFPIHMRKAKDSILKLIDETLSMKKSLDKLFKFQDYFTSKEGREHTVIATEKEFHRTTEDLRGRVNYIPSSLNRRFKAIKEKKDLLEGAQVDENHRFIDLRNKNMSLSLILTPGDYLRLLAAMSTINEIDEGLNGYLKLPRNISHN